MWLCNGLLAYEALVLIPNTKDRNGWRDASAIKSTGCSSRGSEFKSQHRHAGSQPFIIGSDALLWHAGVHAEKTLTYIK